MSDCWVQIPTLPRNGAPGGGGWVYCPGPQGAHPACAQRSVLGGKGQDLPHHEAQRLTDPSPSPGRRPRARCGAHHRGSTPSRPGAQVVLPVVLCATAAGLRSPQGRPGPQTENVDEQCGLYGKSAAVLEAVRALRQGHMGPSGTAGPPCPCHHHGAGPRTEGDGLRDSLPRSWPGS